MQLAFKRILCTVLTIVLVTSIPIQAFGEESATSSKNHPIQDILNVPKENLNFIKGGYDDLSHLEYTYSSKGKNYKVIEDTTDNLAQVNSTIFEQDTSGNFVELAKLTVEVKSSTIETVITPANSIEVQSQSTNSFKGGSNKIVEIFERPNVSNAEGTFIDSNIEKSLAEESSLATLASNPSGLPISDWHHYGNFFYSTKIAKYTIAAVAVTITGIVSVLKILSPGAKATINSTTTLVAFIVDDRIGDIWYTDKVYYKTVVPPDPNMFRMKVAEKTIHTFYSDSGRTQHMKGSPITTEHWLRGYD